MTIDTLTMRVGLDLRDWDRGIDRLGRDAERFVGKFNGLLENLKGPDLSGVKLPGGSAADRLGRQAGGGVGASDPASSFIQPAALKIPGIETATKALVTMADQFKVVGGSILATNRRLDSEVRFEQMQRNITLARGKLQGFAAEAAEDSPKLARAATMIDRAFGGISFAGKLQNQFDALFSLDRKAAAEIDRIKPSYGGLASAGKAALDGLGSATTAVSGITKGFGLQVAAAAGLVGLGYKGVEALKAGVMGAMDFNETLSKTDAVLGASSGAVKGFADSMASQFGLVKGETLDVAAGFGGLAKGLGGLQGDALAKEANALTKMSADLSSFANLSFKDAGQAIRTALSGETSDTLKGLGVVINESAVKSYAYANGLAKVGAELSESQKYAARSALVFAGLKDAAGDLDRTAGSSANQLRKMSGMATNFGTDVGQVLMPAVDAGMRLASEGMGLVMRGFDAFRPTIAGLVDSLSTGFDFAAAAIAHPSAAFEGLKLKASEVFVNIGEWILTIPENFGRMTAWVGDNWDKLLVDFASNALTTFENLVGNFQKFGEAIGRFMADPLKGFQVDFTPLTQGFIRTAEKFPELVKPHLTDLSKEIATAMEPVTTDFNRRRSAAALAGPGISQASASAKMGLEPEAAKAMKTAQDKMDAFVKKFADKVRSPFEEYKDIIKQGTEAFDQKLIDVQQFKGLDAYAMKESGLDKQVNPKVEFAGAVEQGSQEYVSAINRALYGAAQKPDDQVKQLSKQQVTELQQIKQELQRANGRREPEPANRGF